MFLSCNYLASLSIYDSKSIYDQVETLYDKNIVIECEHTLQGHLYTPPTPHNSELMPVVRVTQPCNKQQLKFKQKLRKTYNLIHQFTVYNDLLT